MSAEQDHMPRLSEARAKIEGFASGKIDEIEVEMEEVHGWSGNVKLGSTVKRKDQELMSLVKLKEEIERFRDFVVRNLDEVEDLRKK